MSKTTQFNAYAQTTMCPPQCDLMHTSQVVAYLQAPVSDFLPRASLSRESCFFLGGGCGECFTRGCVTCVTDNPHDVGFWRIRWNPYLTAFTAHEQLKGQVSLPSANRAPRPTPFRKKNFTPRCESFLYPLSFWLLLRWVACDCSVVLRLLGHL